MISLDMLVIETKQYAIVVCKTWHKNIKSGDYLTI